MKKINLTWIIDDDHIQVFVAKRTLNNINFSENIQALDDVERVLEELQVLASSKDDKLPDIIFLDINMPRMDGWQFLKEFEKMSLKKKISIFLVTSSIDPNDARKAETFNNLLT